MQPISVIDPYNGRPRPNNDDAWRKEVVVDADTDDCRLILALRGGRRIHLGWTDKAQRNDENVKGDRVFRQTHSNASFPLHFRPLSLITCAKAIPVRRIGAS